MTSDARVQVERAFPEIDALEDEELREGVLRAWETAIEETGSNDLESLPESRGRPPGRGPARRARAHPPNRGRSRDVAAELVARVDQVTSAAIRLRSVDDLRDA